MSFDVEKDGFQISECRVCYQKMVWATILDTGKKIPLDPTAPTFAVKLKEEGKKSCVARRVERTAIGERVLVSHFSTCVTMTNAGKFTREIKRMMREGRKVSDEEFGKRTRTFYQKYCT